MGQGFERDCRKMVVAWPECIVKLCSVALWLRHCCVNGFQGPQSCLIGLLTIYKLYYPNLVSFVPASNKVNLCSRKLWIVSHVFSKVVITCANCCCCFLIFWNVRKAWNKTITKQNFKRYFFPTLHPPFLHPFHPPPCFARKLLILERMCHVNYTECQIDSITRCAFWLNIEVWRQ